MDLTAFATDKRKEQEGVWKDLGDGRVKIARHNNPKFQAAMAKYSKEFLPFGAEIDISSPELEKATVHAMAETILLDWENIGIGGELLEYSFENAVMVLSKYSDFKELVAQMALDRNNFRPEKAAKK